MFPVRTELTVLPADNEEVGLDEQVIVTSKGKVCANTTSPRQLVLGWKIKETIGIAMVNARGVAAGRKSVIIGD